MTRKSASRAIWLLSAETLKLHEFDDNSPSYATLSCSWAFGAITFEDLVEHDNLSQKASFPELEAACCQARALDLHWVWNDEMCIDRRSSIAVSNGLNSIGDIYRGCSLCIVHLQDFPAGVVTEEERGLYLENCIWTRYAWTLPHLILPEESYFYDSRWTRIGSKSSFRAQLSRLLGIEIGVLDNRNTLAQYSVAKRMSWASGLWAPCIEDKAYSLLSIFGVNMSIQYGEGRRAFLRLQTEILKETQDCSLFAWQSLEIQKHRGFLARSPAEFQHFKCGPEQELRMTGHFHLDRDGISIETTTTDKGHYIYLPLYCRDSLVCSIELLYQEEQIVRQSLIAPRTGEKSLDSKLHNIWVKLDVGLRNPLPVGVTRKI